MSILAATIIRGLTVQLNIFNAVSRNIIELGQSTIAFKFNSEQKAFKGQELTVRLNSDRQTASISTYDYNTFTTTSKENHILSEKDFKSVVRFIEGYTELNNFTL